MLNEASYMVHSLSFPADVSTTGLHALTRHPKYLHTNFDFFLTLSLALRGTHWLCLQCLHLMESRHIIVASLTRDIRAAQRLVDLIPALFRGRIDLRHAGGYITVVEQIWIGLTKSSSKA
jgi:hypothetical protein